MPSRRSFNATAIAVVTVCSAAACTRLLGIDGDYIVDTRPAAGDEGGAGSGGDATSAGGSLDGGGAGGSIDAGGSGGSVDAGNAGGGGGAAGEASGGAGGAVVQGTDAGPPDCRPGTYGGTFDGTHAPAVTFIGFPFNVSGPFGFTLATIAGKSRVLQITKSTGFQSTLVNVGVWNLELTGEFDCGTQELTGKVTGKMAATSLPLSVELRGTLSGTLGAGSGVWQEQEAGAPAPGTCDPTAPPPYVIPVGTGCGTWSITTRP